MDTDWKIISCCQLFEKSWIHEETSSEWYYSRILYQLIRSDGAHNICHAAVVPDGLVLPDDYVYMRNWCGPMWYKGDYQMMWQIYLL